MKSAFLSCLFLLFACFAVSAEESSNDLDIAALTSLLQNQAASDAVSDRIQQAQNSQIICLLGAGGDANKISACASNLAGPANDAIDEAKTVTTENAGNAVLSAQAAISNCLDHMESFVGSAENSDFDNASNSLRTLGTDCSRETIKGHLSAAGDQIRTSVEGCIASGASFTKQLTDLRDSEPSILDVARGIEGLASSGEALAGDCKDAADAATAMGDSTDKFMSALSSTVAFCTAVPEPYSCAAIAILNILMLLFDSGGGDGGGNSEPGATSGSGGDVADPAEPYTRPNDGPNPSLLVAVADGNGCTMHKEDGLNLNCKAAGYNLLFENWFGGASIDLSVLTDGVADADVGKEVENYFSELEATAMDLFFKDRTVVDIGTGFRICPADDEQMVIPGTTADHLTNGAPTLSIEISAGNAGGLYTLIPSNIGCAEGGN